MNDRFTITEAMIQAAQRSAPGPLSHEEIRRILSAGLSKMGGDRNAPYPLWVSTSITVKRARFLGVTERPCYYRVETEDGKELTLHGNDIKPSRGPA